MSLFAPPRRGKKTPHLCSLLPFLVPWLPFGDLLCIRMLRDVKMTPKMSPVTLTVAEHPVLDRGLRETRCDKRQHTHDRSPTGASATQKKLGRGGGWEACCDKRLHTHDRSWTGASATKK